VRDFWRWFFVEDPAQWFLVVAVAVLLLMAGELDRSFPEPPQLSHKYSPALYVNTEHHER
jgi:hypothetical protein